MGKNIIIIYMIVFLIAGCYRYDTYTLPRDKEGKEGGISISKPDRLVLINGAGVYYAPESEEDVFFYGGKWYYVSGLDWFVSESYKGPWRPVLQEALPHAMFRVPPGKFKNIPPGWIEVYDQGKGMEQR